MKVFFVGDFKKSTGPAIANKIYRKGFKRNSNILFSDASSRVGRVFEMIWKIIHSDCVCFCSASRGNILGIRLCKLFSKKTVYLMHGYKRLEMKINSVPNDIRKKEEKYEEYIFREVNRIICVSELHMTKVMDDFPQYKSKITYNYNGLDFKKFEDIKLLSPSIRKKNKIVSIGGGVKLKNNLMVCKAIEKINSEKNFELEYIVIGSRSGDIEEILSYNFVTYFEKLSHEEVFKILCECSIYIQNSFFETFSLATIEALMCGCDLLVSSQIGSLGLMKDINSNDIIYNVNDVNEIKKKIENLISNSNNLRIIRGLDTKQIDYRTAAKLLYKKINQNL